MTQLIPTWMRHPMRTFTLMLFLLTLSFGCRGQDKPNRTQSNTPLAAPPPKGPAQGFHFVDNIYNNTDYVCYSDGQQFTDSIALKTLYYDKAPYIPKGIPEYKNSRNYSAVLYPLEDLTWTQKKQAFGHMFAGNKAFQDSLKTAAFCTHMASATPVPNGLIVSYTFVLFRGSMRDVYGTYGEEQLSETTYQWYNSKFEKEKSIVSPHALLNQFVTKEKRYMVIESCDSRYGDIGSVAEDVWLIDIQNTLLLGKIPVTSNLHEYFEFKYDDKKNIYYSYLNVLDKRSDETIKYKELIVFDPSDCTVYSKILDIYKVQNMYNKETREMPVPDWNKSDLKGYVEKKLIKK
jgi:hypothetical protein